jgi:serine/threonine protein kinase
VHSGQHTPPNPTLPCQLLLTKAPDRPFDAGSAYALRRIVGRGAFGCVWAADCRATGVGVAIKRVSNAAGNVVAAKRLLREMRLLRLLGGHANVVRLLNVVSSQSDDQARSLEQGSANQNSMRSVNSFSLLFEKRKLTVSVGP